ncbi:Glutathione synthetase [subsurface metagenome]
MRVAILARKEKWHVSQLKEAFNKFGINCDHFPIDKFEARIDTDLAMSSEGYNLKNYRGVIVRVIPVGSLEQIIFRVDVLHRLERAGIQVINSPKSIERTVDKYFTSSLLKEAGIPTPKTVVTERMDIAMEAVREMKDVLVKPLFGNSGNGIVRVTDPDLAYRVFNALKPTRAVYYIQEFIPHNNQDIRAFVVGEKAVAAMTRSADNWKTNIARGGVAQEIHLDAEEYELSVRAAQAVGADYAGVDIIRSEEGRYFVVEVNGIPGWSGLQKVVSVNIAEKIAKHLIGKIELSI